MERAPPLVVALAVGTLRGRQEPGTLEVTEDPPLLARRAQVHAWVAVVAERPVTVETPR
jgi:hypothetical protein